MAYRDEDGLDRRAWLVRALGGGGLDEAAREALAAELAVADEERRARARRHLPQVLSARIASPCLEIWETMVGDDAVRACSRCDREVFDLGAMTLAQAEALIESRKGSTDRTCVRLHRRTDGTMMFADCEVGANGVRTRRIAVALASLAISASALAATATYDQPLRYGRSFLDPTDAHSPSEGYSETMGEMEAVPFEAPEPTVDSPPFGEPGFILTSSRGR